MAAENRNVGRLGHSVHIGERALLPRYDEELIYTLVRPPSSLHIPVLACSLKDRCMNEACDTFVPPRGWNILGDRPDRRLVKHTCVSVHVAGLHPYVVNVRQ